jgi:hypothetical protein
MTTTKAPTSAHDRLSNAFASAATEQDAERRRALAATYHPAPRHDALLALRDTNPAAWAGLSPDLRLAVGFYEAAKTAHDEETTR